MCDEFGRVVDVDSLELPDPAAARGAALRISSRAAVGLFENAVRNVRLETRVDTEAGDTVYHVTLTITSGPSER